jgi:hypothetical protein
LSSDVAYDLLETYRSKLLCFNDDIQVSHNYPSFLWTWTFMLHGCRAGHRVRDAGWHPECAA